MRTTTLLFLVTMLAGCGGGSSEAEGEQQGASTGGEATGTPREVCLATMRRERECADTFIPAHVELRVRLDQPAGIAAQDQSAGREALVAQARQEYETDATEETFAANCAQLDEMPPERAQGMVEALSRCLETTECGAFVECDIANHEQRMRGYSAE